jgi:hypothetical protein
MLAVLGLLLAIIVAGARRTGVAPAERRWMWLVMLMLMWLLGGLLSVRG